MTRESLHAQFLAQRRAGFSRHPRAQVRARAGSSEHAVLAALLREPAGTGDLWARWRAERGEVRPLEELIDGSE